MMAGNRLLLTIGALDNPLNAASLNFNYEGDGAEANRLSMGFYAVNDILNIMANGRVGIGTTDPQAKFEIRSSNPDEAVTLSIGNSDLSHQVTLFPGRENDRNPFIQWTGGDTLRFSTDEGGWSEKMRITADGNVGIGTEFPEQLLDVAGTIRSTSGGFMFPDGTTQSTAVSSSAGNSLDQAYDHGGVGAGRIITADAGAVGIAGSGGIWVNGHISGLGGLTLSGSGGDEGGQLSLLDSDGEGSWIMDSYGGTDSEALRFFRGSGYNDIFNALVINGAGNVGIGIGGPAEKLSVAGTVQSTSGGFRFPDGTIQTTASGGGSATSINDLTDGRVLGYSVFLGSGAGANDDGDDNHNTAVGTDALNLTDTGEQNTAVGSSALVSNADGIGNTALGYWALNHNTSGIRNVGIGHSANIRNQTGSYNTMIGFGAGAGTSLHSKSGNVFIGYMAGVYESGDNLLYIENSNSDEPLIGGDFAADQIDLNGEVYVRDRFGVGTTTPAAGIHLVGTGYPNSFMFLEAGSGNDAGIRLYEGSADKWHIFNDAGRDGLHIYNNVGTTAIFADQTNSYVGIGTTSPTSMLTVAGTAEVNVLEINGGSDIAEPFDIYDTKEIKTGMVMTIDADNPGQLKISEKAYDRCVAGIISGAGGINPGMIMGQAGSVADGEFPVALTGRVYCWADASQGTIQPGDLLTTSDIPGHAMKAADYSKAQGAVIGKAMSALEEGQGLVLVLVSLQ